MSREELRELIDGWLDAHMRRDAAFFDRVLDDDVEWTMHGPPQAFPVPNPLRGKAAVLEALKQMGEAVNVVRSAHRQVLIDGDQAAVIADRTAVQRTTGRTLVYRVAAFMRFRDGKLVEYQSFYDGFDVMEQVLGHPLNLPDSY